MADDERLWTPEMFLAHLVDGGSEGLGVETLRFRRGGAPMAGGPSRARRFWRLALGGWFLGVEDQAQGSGHSQGDPDGFRHIGTQRIRFAGAWAFRRKGGRCMRKGIWAARSAPNC